MFVDGICSIPDVTLGGREILPGLTKTDLMDADWWYTNDYRQEEKVMAAEESTGAVLSWEPSHM